VNREEINASGNAVGRDNNVSDIVDRVNGTRASHGVAEVAIHGQVASQGTGLVNVVYDEEVH
jgi:uncharacterized protein YkwD